MNKTKKSVTYKFYSDAGHGWLAVKRSELYRLGIASQITPFSYQKGHTVYLEEDCDMTLFIQTKKRMGEPVEIQEKYSDRSWIRNLQNYH